MIPIYEPQILPEYIASVQNQLKLGWIGPGKTVKKLESLLCDITGVKHAIATTSGTMALMMAAYCLLPKKSTVLYPAYGYAAGANVLNFLGHKIKLIDIDPKTLCMNPEKIHKDNDSNGILYIEHNGYTGKTDLDRLYPYTPIISDSAVALGCGGAGKMGSCGIFSFSVPKLVTTGQGGAIITDRDDLAEKLRDFQDQGGNWRKDRRFKKLGLNLRMSDLTASLGIPQLENLNKLLAFRLKIWSAYRLFLKDLIHSQTKLGFYHDIYNETGWCIIVEHPQAEQLIKFLHKHDIGASRFYKAVWQNKHLRKLGGKNPNKSFPVAVQKARDLVYLPSSLTLTEIQIEYICEIIRQFLGGSDETKKMEQKI